jgi:hypothetical protein
MQTSQLDHNPKIAPPEPAGKIPPTFKVFCEFGTVEARPKRAACGPGTQPRIANRIWLQSTISARSGTYCDFRSSVLKPSVNQP